MRYRTKIVEIEAKLFDGSFDSGTAIDKWSCGTAKCIQNKRTGTVMVRVQTLEGTMTASPGDYIIKGLCGEFYPCKPGVFKAKYELVLQ